MNWFFFLKNIFLKKYHCPGTFTVFFFGVKLIYRTLFWEFSPQFFGVLFGIFSFVFGAYKR
jgi:hypothetical protein